MNYCVAETYEDSVGVLNILAPFSVATQSGNGLEFYKRLRKEKSIVKTELEQITTNLITRINATLPQMISLADPCAHLTTISETHQREFSLPYLIQLLRGLETTSGGVVHLCPYSSFLLEKYGFVNTEMISFSAKPYIAMLMEYVQSNQLVFIGCQCIHTKTTDKIFILHLSDNIL
jgi:hypothetical protein